MGKKIKKGTTGDAAKYCTRSTALRKLKLSLKEFRRLCILKGIFPKEPKKKFKGQNKTYYLLKDIRFLAHEKLINKFREINAFQKKINKAKEKSNKYDMKKLKDNKPKYSIQHIIKERYPKFVDALNDLDDALSLISLFSILPKHEMHNIKSETIESCQRLTREFFLYLAISKGIKRSFISIKGFYLNTEIMGIDVTWLTPFSLPQKLPFEVDYEVMLTFVELYQTLMKFINLKLYKDLGVEYPPPADKAETPFFGYDSITLRSLQEQVQSTILSNKEKMEEDMQNNLIQSEELSKIQKKNERAEKLKSLLKPYVFFISREVPREVIQLLILSMGGVYGDDSISSAFSDESPEITHYIVDRPHESIDYIPNKEYVQPQWIFDCLNACKVLPTADYAPQKAIVTGKGNKKETTFTKLPPHISPFFEYNIEKSSYLPKDIKKPEDAKVEDEFEAIEPEPTEEEKEKERKGLNEMLLSKNKRKILQRIRENNNIKLKKRKIVDI